MSKSKHTPGPWHSAHGRMIRSKDDHSVAQCTLGWGIEADECRANTRLIAAAPELLAACKRVLVADAVHHPGDAGPNVGLVELAEVAKAVIKAEARSSCASGSKSRPPSCAASIYSESTASSTWQKRGWRPVSGWAGSTRKAGSTPAESGNDMIFVSRKC